MSTMLVSNTNDQFNRDLYCAVQNREPQNADLIYEYIRSQGVESFYKVLSDSGLLLDYINEALVKISKGELEKTPVSLPPREALNLERNVSYPDVPYYNDNGFLVR